MIQFIYVLIADTKFKLNYFEEKLPSQMGDSHEGITEKGNYAKNKNDTGAVHRTIRRKNRNIKVKQID